MKYLNGSELAGFIKERQLSQVKTLVNKNKVQPKLAIIVTVKNPVIEIYLRLKKKYGEDIGVDVQLYRTDIKDIKEVIAKLNIDNTINGIIVQLPVADESKTDEIVNLVKPSKDVDGLGLKSKFDPATPQAILWLLSGYNVELNGKNIVIVGKGKLVGKPLSKAFISSGITPKVIDKKTKDIKNILIEADIIITATGVPGLIKSNMIKPSAVVLDAGVASESGKTVGDVDEEVFKTRDDLTITPTKGGVGPLTVCSLFENLIRAAEK